MMKSSYLIALSLSLSSASFAFTNPLPEIISFIPSIVSSSINPMNFKEHWDRTSVYLNSLDTQAKLVGDFGVNTGTQGNNQNIKAPKINSVMFGTEHIA